MAIPLLTMDSKIKQVRTFMEKAKLDAWLIYDFEGNDPTGQALLGHLTPKSRQYAIFIAREDPILLIKSNIESHELNGLTSDLKVIEYRTQAEFMEAVGDYGANFASIAANFSENAVTDILPAGRLAFFRSTCPNTRWVSGENLMQIIHSVLTKSQLASHKRASLSCTEIMKQAFDFIAEQIGSVSEQDVADYILARFSEENLTTVDSPMVAVNAHTADVHYTPGDSIIQKDSLIMIDLWAKWEVFTDMTWMAYAGSNIPEDIQNVWNTVLRARDIGVKAVKAGIPGSIPDEKVRTVLIEAGFEEAILHRTGHSIDSLVHGRGANLDSFEMPETRLLLPNLIVSVEPGIYFRNRFGVRSEINVIVTQTGSLISTPPQKELLCI